MNQKLTRPTIMPVVASLEVHCLPQLEIQHLQYAQFYGLYDVGGIEDYRVVGVAT